MNGPRVIFCAILIPVWLLSTGSCRGQSDSLDTHFFIAYPILIYTPETSLGFGVAALAGFRLDKKDVSTPISQVQFGSTYTLNRQFIVSAPFQLYFPGRKHSLYGEFTYNRFFYYFFGVGAEQPSATRERYESVFPRIRVHYLRRLSNYWFTGVRYWYEHQRFLDTEPGGLLATQAVPGAAGGAAAGPGLVLLFDSRDNLFSSQSGVFAEMSFHHQSRYTASDYEYDRVRLDLRHFAPITSRQTLASMLLAEQITGSPPFYGMAALGSEKRLRGYYDGYFRGKSLSLIQLEWRYRFNSQFGMALFTGTAWMGGQPDHLTIRQTLWSAGGGFRFRIDPESRVTLRLDYAFGAHSDAFYFSVGEAF